MYCTLHATPHRLPYSSIRNHAVVRGRLIRKCFWCLKVGMPLRANLKAGLGDAATLMSCVAGFCVGFGVLAVALILFIHTRGEPKYQHNPHLPDCAVVKPIDLPISALKTGDLFALSYMGVRTQFSRLSYNSVFTHVCMVYCDPATREPFILEAAAYDVPYDCNVVRIPYLTWARINRACRAVVWLPINKALDERVVSAAFSRFEELDVGVEGLKASWFRFLDPPRTPYTVDPTSLFAKDERRVRPKHPERCVANVFFDLADAMPVPEFVKPRSIGLGGDVFEYTLACHEIVLDVLQKAGAMSPKYTPCSYTPKQIVAREIPMTNGYAYGEPQTVSMWAMFKESRL